MDREQGRQIEANNAALNGHPDMEAYYRMDAALHPESRRQYPPLAVTSLPEYQRVTGEAVDAQVIVDKWSDCLKCLNGSQTRLKDAASGRPKLDDDQQSVLLAAAKALSPFVMRAARGRNDAVDVLDKLRGKLRQIVEQQRAKNPMLDSERFSGMGVEEFNRRGVELEALKGKA